MAREQQMIEPFVDRQVRVGSISYGLSSFGYDIRVADEFRIFTPATGQLTVVDPKAIDERAMVPYQGDVCIIPPNSFALARTVEYFRIPRNVLCVCLGKSTYARIGVIVNITPFEPEWQGHVTIEISNTTPLPCKIYANEGIAQVLFFEGEEPEVSYADRQGKYQAQTGITLPRLENKETRRQETKRGFPSLCLMSPCLPVTFYCPPCCNDSALRRTQVFWNSASLRSPFAQRAAALVET